MVQKPQKKINAQNVRNDYKGKAERMGEMGLIDYSVLSEASKENQIKRLRKYMEIINDRIVPYEIPTVYSLKYEKNALLLRKKRLDIISRNICRTDVESIALDLKQIGGDLNGAICKYRECYAGKD